MNDTKKRYIYDARDWLTRAGEDILHAQHEIEGEFYRYACFSAQ